MADTKTSALSAAGAAPALNDLVIVIDVSDTSMSATGTNKKITVRNFRRPVISTEASSATPTIDTDAADMHRITALAVAITSMTSGLSGTPWHGQKFVVEILDDGTGRAITWGASYRSTDTGTLPTTTTANKLLSVFLMYDSADSIWECRAVSNEA